MNFSEYEKIKNESIDKLNRVETTILSYKNKLNEISFDTIYNPNNFNRYKSELSKNLKISVFAEISNGKSTFLNALIFKDEILHSDIGEITFGLFKISYSKNIEYIKDGKRVSGINSLEDVIDQIEKDNELAKEKEEFFRVEIKLNDERLAGIEIIDTPGFGSIREEKLVDILFEATKDADGVIFIFDISKGAKAEELTKQKKYIDVVDKSKLWIILNKLDTIKKRRRDSEEEFENSILNVSFDTLEKISHEKIETKSIEELRGNRVYPLSAKEALDGKIENDEKLLTKSKFSEFESDFWDELPKFKIKTLNETLSKIDEEFEVTLANIDLKSKTNADLVKDKKEEIIYLQNIQKENTNILSELESSYSEFEPILKESEKNLIYLYYYIRNSNELLEIVNNSSQELIKNISASLNNFEFWHAFKFEGKTEELIKDGIKKSELTIEAHIENYVYIKVDDYLKAVKSFNKGVVAFNKRAKFDLKEIEVESFTKDDVEEIKVKLLSSVTSKYISIVEEILNLVEKLFISINPFGKSISKRVKEKVMPQFEEKTIDILKSSFYDVMGEFNHHISNSIWQASENVKNSNEKIKNRIKYIKEDEREKIKVISIINKDIESLEKEIEDLRELKSSLVV